VQALPPATPTSTNAQPAKTQAPRPIPQPSHLHQPGLAPAAHHNHTRRLGAAAAAASRSRQPRLGGQAQRIVGRIATFGRLVHAAVCGRAGHVRGRACTGTPLIRKGEYAWGAGGLVLVSHSSIVNAPSSVIRWQAACASNARLIVGRVGLLARAHVLCSACRCTCAHMAGRSADMHMQAGAGVRPAGRHAQRGAAAPQPRTTHPTATAPPRTPHPTAPPRTPPHAPRTTHTHGARRITATAPRTAPCGGGEGDRGVHGLTHHITPCMNIGNDIGHCVNDIVVFQTMN